MTLLAKACHTYPATPLPMRHAGVWTTATLLSELSKCGVDVHDGADTSNAWIVNFNNGNDNANNKSNANFVRCVRG